MAKNNNKGFSLVEIIIAIAVFAILIIPLTAQLINSVNVNKNSTKKQYAIEKAEGIMESFKVCTFPANKGDTVVIDDYVFTKSDSITENKPLPTGEIISYNIDTYTCSDIAIGESYEKYDCEVTVSGLAYAISAAGYLYDRETGSIKVDAAGNPVKSTTSTGTIRALDNNQFSIITGATYTGPTGVNGNNLDVQAYQYFYDVKVDLLKQFPVAYGQYLSGARYFDNDMFQKYTTIEVSKEIDGYLVKCIVRYVDSTRSPVVSVYTNNEYKPDTTFGAGSGIVYQQTFEELPPIYLLYMPATYDGIYCQSDYVELDTSGLPAGEDVSFYIFETAADIDPAYEQIIVDHFNSVAGYNIRNVNDLIYYNPGYATEQGDVKVHVNLVDGDSSKLNVYANFNVFDGNIPIKSLAEDENNDVYLYDLHVTLTDSNNVKTEVSGTRGR